MTVSHLDLNNWLLSDRETAVEEFSNHHIRIDFEKGYTGAWLTMKHEDSNFALRRFVVSEPELEQAFKDAQDLMPEYLATVERINAAYPETKAVPFYSQADSVQCADWTIDNLQPNNPWRERNSTDLHDGESRYRGKALGVLNRACVYQEFLVQAATDKDVLIDCIKHSTRGFAKGEEVQRHQLAFANDDHALVSPDYDAEDPYAVVPVENKVFFSVDYSEDGTAIDVYALAMTFDGGNPQHYQVEANAQATIQDDGQIFLANRSSDEYMAWSFTEQELGLHDGNLSVMQFAGVSACDTLTSNHAYQSSASEDFLASIDGNVFTQEEPSHGRDSGSGMGL